MAAEPKTEMEPFTVEAEFGMDGLRIQNSRSVLNPYLLELHGIAQLQDISGAAPNLYNSSSDSRGFGDILVLRGLANTLFFSPPAVGLYVDGVPSGSVSSYPSSLLNFENVIINAGPQGTSHGRNAPAGMIEVLTRTPGPQHRGTLQADYGSFHSTRLQAVLDGPIHEDFAYSAAVGYTDREGYIENTFLNRSADDRSSVAGRGAIYWQASDTLQVRLGLMAEKIDDDAARLSSLQSPDPFVVASDLNGETQIDRLHLFVQAQKYFPWGTLRATTSRQEFDLDPATTDLDLSPESLAFSRVTQNEKVWTQEVRIASDPASDRTQWRAGLFFLDSETDGDALREFFVPAGPFLPVGFVQTERTIFTIGRTNLAGYANIDHPLTQRSTLEFGVRLEHVESGLDREKSSSNSIGLPLPRDPRIGRSQSDEYVSISSGLVHAASEAVSLQVRTSLAHKPAGFSAFTGNPQLARFGSEQQWSTEAGITFGPPNGRFGGSVLGFWSLIDDYQLERTVPNSTDFVVVNAGEVIARGIEAKFMWNPVERLWWDFQAGYNRTTFEDHRDAAGTRVDENYVPYVPRFTVRTGVTVELGNGVSANASYAAVGRSFFDERNTHAFTQAMYGFVNAQLRFSRDRWTAAIYGQNLTDEEYYQFINPEIFAGSPGAPRRFGIQVSFTY